MNQLTLAEERFSSLLARRVWLLQRIAELGAATPVTTATPDSDPLTVSVMIARSVGYRMVLDSCKVELSQIADALPAAQNQVDALRTKVAQLQRDIEVALANPVSMGESVISGTRKALREILE
jgi:malonyl CoA-acyl carrier protein transacylase